MPGVVVGLSGGVDSAVAALLLVRSGHDVRAATLELLPSDNQRSCCSPEAVRRATAVAGALGVPHDVVCEAGAFTAAVVTPFIDAYRRGRTPNPCVDCNPWRFARLCTLADAAGATHIATGHYARVVRRGGRVLLARGRDAGKDQSYMLWRLRGAALERLLLPLGESTKTEVREAARAAGLPAAEAAESQEVCFAPLGYRQFLAERGVADRRGRIIAEDGTVLGEHDGIWRFTVGQRRGLGLAVAAPLYVLRVDPATGSVVVGPRERLAAATVAIGDLVDYDLRDGEDLSLQIRYRSRASAVARLRRPSGTRAVAELTVPVEAVAPGQAAVFYRDDVVVGGGVVAGSAGDHAAAERM